MDELTIHMRRFAQRGWTNIIDDDIGIINPEGFSTFAGKRPNIHPLQIQIEERRRVEQQIIEEMKFPRNTSEFIFILDIVKRLDLTYIVLAAQSDIPFKKLLGIITNSPDADADAETEEGDINIQIWDKIKEKFFQKIGNIGIDVMSLVQILEGEVDWTGDHIDGKVIELMSIDYQELSKFLGITIRDFVGIILGDYKIIPLIPLLQKEIVNLTEYISEKTGDDPIHIHQYICNLIRGNDN